MLRRAFTLIEVLVVIAIVAILIALLMPAVYKAKSAAIQVQCASRIRAVAHAFSAYALDNDGQMVCTSGNGQRSDNWVYWQQGRDINQSPLARYLSFKGDRLRDLFRCPAQPPENALGFQGGRPYPLTFTMNGFLIFYPHVRFTGVVHPEHKILLYDENENADDDIFWYMTDRDTLAGRHGSFTMQVADINDKGTRSVVRQMGNVAFFDGHVDLADNQMCHTAGWNDPTMP